jgi:hypothetical protein
MGISHSWQLYIVADSGQLRIYLKVSAVPASADLAETMIKARSANRGFLALSHPMKTGARAKSAAPARVQDAVSLRSL